MCPTINGNNEKKKCALQLTTNKQILELQHHIPGCFFPSLSLCPSLFNFSSYILKQGLNIKIKFQY